MSKAKPAVPEDVRAEQPACPAPVEDRLEVRPQVGVLAAQVEDALRRADGAGGDGHALEDEVGVVGSRITRSLNVPGLALVGVADDVLRSALAHPGGRREVPLRAGREARAAAAPQVRGRDLADDVGAALLQRRGQAGARLDRVEGQGSLLAVDGMHDDAPPLRVRGLRGVGPEHRAALLEDPVHLLGGDPGVDAVVHEQRRPLVAHAQAARPLEAEPPVRRRLAEADAQVVLELARHARLAGQVARDGLAQPDLEAPARLVVQEA